ncbi:hypothetical protein [Microcoleus sp. AR_TQ3_B6]
MSQLSGKRAAISRIFTVKFVAIDAFTKFLDLKQLQSWTHFDS